MENLSISWGRDYRTQLNRYEFCIYRGEQVVERAGGFTSSGAAKRAGLKKASELAAQS